eukprot:7388925-Prymnesium_polylepis.1
MTMTNRDSPPPAPRPALSRFVDGVSVHGSSDPRGLGRVRGGGWRCAHFSTMHVRPEFRFRFSSERVVV